MYHREREKWVWGRKDEGRKQMSVVKIGYRAGDRRRGGMCGRQDEKVKKSMRKDRSDTMPTAIMLR